MHYSKRDIVDNPPESPPLVWHTLIPSFLPLSEASLEVLCHVCCYGLSLDVLPEPHVAGGQASRVYEGPTVQRWDCGCECST